MAFDPAAYLAELAAFPDEKIDLAKAAVALAAAAQPGVSAEKYIHHVGKLAEKTAEHYAEFLKAGGRDDVETRLAALKRAISEEAGYRGDTETYEDIQNASLIRVIDRAKGMPIALAILYISAGRAQGWDIAGLDFPGHFVCRIEKDGRRLIFDPFYECRLLDAADLRLLLKKIRGPEAELSASYFEAASNRAVLMRLENNIKYRQIEVEDYEGALKTVEIMRMIDQQEYRLWLDAGVLYARTGRAADAIRILEDYIKKAPRHSDRHDAAVLLQELKDRE